VNKTHKLGIPQSQIVLEQGKHQPRKQIKHRQKIWRFMIAPIDVLVLIMDRNDLKLDRNDFKHSPKNEAGIFSSVHYL